jgi:hypothetical protein
MVRDTIALCTSFRDANILHSFCKNNDFINKVYGCLSSWSQSADNTTNGVSYLIGLCAAYIPENPAIVTGCPSTVTPAVYTPPAPTKSSPITDASPPPTAPASVPCTTITYSSEVIVPATYSTGSSQGSEIPSSSCTSTIVTTVTVPQVQITTLTVTESGSTVTKPELGYGTPTTPQSTAPPAQPPLTTDSGPAPAPPYVTSTSTLEVAPPYVSSGFVTSQAPTAAPTGIEVYQGTGSKGAIGGMLAVAVGAIVPFLVL